MSKNKYLRIHRAQRTAQKGALVFFDQIKEAYEELGRIVQELEGQMILRIEDTNNPDDIAFLQKMLSNILEITDIWNSGQ